MTSARPKPRIGGVAAEPHEEGPSLRAIPFLQGLTDRVRLLTPRQRLQLGGISTQLRLPGRMVVYREGTGSQSIFIVGTGVVKAFRDLPSGKRRVMAFLFAGDIFGLAEGGLYVNTIQTVTAATIYRMRRDALAETLRSDAELEFQFLCKVTHELRESMRQTVVVSRRDAAGRLAMFLRMLEQRTEPRGASRIDVPMSRSDIANYLGLSLEAVSRASRALERAGIIDFSGRHEVQILDRLRFEKLAAAV